MKYYVDYNNGQIKIDVEKEFYQSENLENKITVLLTNVADPEDEVVPAYFLSIEFLRSDGRKCTIQTADAFGEEEDTTLTEDDVTYDIHNFTLTEQVLKCAGTLMFTVYINFVNSDTGKVIRRGVIFNGVNNVKKTVPYSTNSLLVIDDESEAEDNVTNILDELTAINAALATKQKKLVLQSDSGLTMTDSYKLKVKGNGNTGISVETKGVTLNYDNLSWITDFQTLPKSSTGNRTFGLSYYYNTIPVNQAIITEYNGQIGATNSLVEFAVESSSDEDTTTYTYTFSGTTANKIKENLERSVWISQTSSLWSNSAFVDKYGLSFVSSQTVCSSLLTRLCRMVKDESLIAEGYFIFKPIARKNNVIYYSCSNFVCTDTESSPRKPRTLSVVLGLVKDGNNFKVEFVEDNTTNKNISASNNTRVNYTSHMITGLEISSAEYGDSQGKKIKILDETNERYLDFGIDYAPTADSEHLVFSGGVKSAIDDLEAALNADIEASGHTIELALDSTNYKITAVLKDANGNTISTSTEIDLPLESVVVSGAYDDTTKKVVLTLQNGSTIEFSVADLVSGLQAEITAQNKLDADLVDDTNSTHKFVSASEKQDISNLKNGTDTTNVITITKTYNQTAAEYTSGLSEVDISGYVTQSDYNKLNINTTIYISLEFTDIKMKYILKPSSYTVDASDNTVQSWVFRTDSGSAVDVYGMFEMYGFIQYDRAYDFTLKAVQVYSESEVNTLLAAKQDVISGSSSIDVTANVVSVKDDYITGQFLTDSEMTTLLSEVFD